MIRSLKFYFIVAKGKCIKEQMVPARTKGKKSKRAQRVECSDRVGVSRHSHVFLCFTVELF